MQPGSDVTKSSQPMATVYRLYDGKIAPAPVVIFDFPNHSELAKHTQTRIKDLCMNTNEYYGPLSQKRLLNEEEKQNVFEFLRYDCRPRDAKGTVFGYSQKTSNRPIGLSIKTTEELFDHVMSHLYFLKKDEVVVKDITSEDLMHWSKEPEHANLVASK